LHAVSFLLLPITAGRPLTAFPSGSNGIQSNSLRVKINYLYKLVRFVRSLPQIHAVWQQLSVLSHADIAAGQILFL